MVGKSLCSLLSPKLSRVCSFQRRCVCVCFSVAQHGAELKSPHCLTVSCVLREEPFTDFHTLIPKILVCMCMCVCMPVCLHMVCGLGRVH